jgi:streptogramin lyase
MARKDHSGRTFHQAAAPAVDTAQVRARMGICAGLAALVTAFGASPAAAHEPWVTEFNAGLTLNIGAWDIAAADDGNLWFTQDALNTFSRITPSAVITDFPDAILGGGPRGITAGPDGNIWVAEAGGNGAIARMTPEGVVTEFDLNLTPGDPWDITAGPDGNLWFVNRNPAVVGRITPDGEITEFTDGLTAVSQPSAITTGPDGNLWFTETSAGRIGRITPDGEITEFTSGLSGSDEPTDITAGPDGALWFTLNADPGGIGRITKAGDVTVFTDGLTADSRPVGIAKGPDGALWFTESASPGRIGSITTSGLITEYTGGLTVGAAPWFITAGPDGNMWFTENALLGRVARITLPPVLRGMGASDVDTTSALLRGKVRPNSQATNYHFEYGTTADYGRATESAYVGNGYDLELVTELVEALDPATAYHFRVVADNDSGTSYGPDRVFETLPLPVSEPSSSEPGPEREPVKEPEPDFGKSIVVEPEGSVRVKEPGGSWQTLEPGAELPVGASFDTRRGAVSVTSAGCRGRRQTGRFGGGLFMLRQPRRACGRVDVYLRGGSFASCARAAHRPSGRRASASRSRRVRRLWGRDTGGSFRTHGRNSQATVRGTSWLTLDRCDGTLTRVTDGAVSVRDQVRHRTVLVRAGHSYLAKSRAALRRQQRRRG